jgi:CBS domain-containing protein
MIGVPGPWRVVWSGDDACRSLADILGDPRPVRASRDVWGSLVEARATLHVARHLPSFERCSVAVPHHVVVGDVTGVVAAVGGGPHSLLAAATARRIAERLDVKARVVAGYRRPELRPSARAALEDIAAAGIWLPMEAVATEHPLELVANLPKGTLVVIGAPGGSWFQRQFFGPGVRLKAAAPGGVVVVRQDVRRVYQVMSAPVAVGSHMRVRDVLELTTDPVVLVAEHGKLVGVVRRGQLMGVRSHIEVGAVTEPPVTVAAEEPLEHILLLLDEHGGGPVGVVSADDRLIGSVGTKEVSAALRGSEEWAS